MTKLDTTNKMAFSLKKAAAGKDPVIKEEPSQTKTTPSVPAAEMAKEYERFNFICDKSLAAKARAISRKEGFTIRSLMEKAMSDFFAKYEAKNGKVGDLISKDINEVL